MILRLLLFLFACFFFGNTYGENIYTVYIPKTIRPGFDISLTATILVQTNVNITAKLMSSDGIGNLMATATVNGGSSKKISLGSLPRDYTGSHKFNFSVTGVNAVSGEQLFHNTTKGFTYASKSLTILIQTDKAIYQPGQTIKFRAVVLKPDLKALKGQVRYEVRDPQGNLVMREDANLTHGVVGDEFMLTKDAANGNWEITYKALGFEEKMKVEVKFYKLPKFKVEVQVPNFIHPKSPGFTIKLKGTYTYGKPVKGSASLSLQMTYMYGGPVYFSSGRRFGPNPQNPGIQISVNNFDGVYEKFIPMDDIVLLLGWNKRDQRKISVTGSVTDGQTDITIKQTSQIDVETDLFKVEELYKPNTIKPGLFYTAYIKVVQKDGTPLLDADRLNRHLVVDLTFRYPRGTILPGDTRPPSPWYTPQREEKKTFAIPENGIVILKFKAPNDNFTSVYIRAYVNGTNTWQGLSFQVDRANSPSNSYMQISTNDSTVIPGQNTSITIKTTEAVSSFRVIVLSRGQIMSDASYTATGSMNEHDYNLMVTYDMIPAVQVLASYVRSDGEIVADYLKLTVSTDLRNKVSISSSATRVDAGDDVSIRVQTSSAGAYVGARAIDQSVLLLKSGSDISKERIANDLNEYSSSESHDFWRWWWWYPIPSGGKDASEVFSKAGVLVLTDALLYKSEPELTDIYPPVLFASETNGGAAGPVVYKTEINRVVATPPAVRSYFPETWLWTAATSGSDGAATFNTKAPDTITSWILSAFSVSDQYGFGLADTSKITVFRQFFVSLNLPVKITRGEAIIVQATVFNYLDSRQTVRVTLEDSSSFELIRPGNDPIAAGPVRDLSVPSNGAVSVMFPVRMSSLGDVSITVSAVAELAQDALTRVVYVRPEGIKDCYSSSILINRDNDKALPTTQDFQINIPAGIVPGSQNVKVFVYGDILGNTLKNLGQLLRQPSGCGEQNMLGFAPDVFVTLYLKKANKLDAALEAKTKQHFYTGYYNEIKYKHPDGAYSAFGGGRGEGSTWLTAFVAKCFIFARELQPNLVSADVINEALDYLVSKQNKEGVFVETGKVYHRDMQGGVDSDVTMTAYVLVTLKETAFPYKNKKVQQAGDKARAYLEGQLENIRNDSYALAIVTYALTVSESNLATKALGYLNLEARTLPGMKYWGVSTTDASTYKSRWWRPYYSPPTNEVEMTAYALLTYVRMNDVGSATPIMKWLASKQNPTGGYTTTQDTVIAIQAMSSVAGLLIARPQDLNIAISHSVETNFTRSFHLDKDNSVIFNQVDVPDVDGNLQVSAIGTGIGVAQLSVCYNIPTDPFAGEPFACDLNVLKSDSKLAHIDFCCRLKPEDKNATGMFVFEVKLPNGFTVDIDNEKERNRHAQLVELGDDSVNVYYNNLGLNERKCAKLQLIRYQEVANIKPQPVLAFDYYSPKRQVKRLLNIRALENADVCTLCGEQCVGCPGPRLSDWLPWTPCTRFCHSQTSTRTKKCIDPNNNEVLATSRCGISVLPVESKKCPDSGFPCPDVTDGLWTGASYLNAPQRRSPPACSARRSTRKATNIPGSILGGYQCSAPGLSKSINASLGLTISLLIKPPTKYPSKPYIFFSSGMRGYFPVYTFEKVFWKNEFRFQLRYGRKVYRVREIPSSVLASSQWNHVVVTWNGKRAAVYINAVQKGVPSSFSTWFQRNPSRPSFFIGEGTFNNVWRKGYATNTSVSALNYWNRPLQPSEVKSLYNFYADLIGPNNPNPVMSVRQLRHFAPQYIDECLKTPMSLKTFEASNNICSALPPPVPLPVF